MDTKLNAKLDAVPEAEAIERRKITRHRTLKAGSITFNKAGGNLGEVLVFSLPIFSLASKPFFLGLAAAQALGFPPGANPFVVSLDGPAGFAAVLSASTNLASACARVMGPSESTRSARLRAPSDHPSAGPIAKTTC